MFGDGFADVGRYGIDRVFDELSGSVEKWFGVGDEHSQGGSGRQGELISPDKVHRTIAIAAYDSEQIAVFREARSGNFIG